MFMLHKMSEVRGWTHDTMLHMKKRVFYRYYGYWYAEQLNAEIQRETEEAKQKLRR